MMNVLVPTDFSYASIRLAEEAIRTLNKPVNIYLFHAFQMPDSETGFIRERAPYLSLLNDKLRQSCKKLKEEYPYLINSISFRFMQGETLALFRNFLQANEIDMIVAPADYHFSKVHPASINPMHFFEKSGLPLLKEFPGQARKEKTAKVQQPVMVSEFSVSVS